jgi:RNA polymerase sigma-B factor
MQRYSVGEEDGMSAADDAGVESPVFHDLDDAAEDYARLLVGADERERERLREDLIRGCMPFAGRLSRRFAGRGESAEDLEQVARLGLVNAVDRYDPQRGSFTAFAVVTISGEIKRHFRDRTWGVHVPRRLQDLSLEVGHASVVLSNVLARRPTAAELADHLRIPEQSIVEAMESAAGYTPASLNAPLGGGPQAAELGDLFGDVDRDLESVDDRLTVSCLLLRLPARERRMLAMRFYGNRTQSEIAAELGISQMHVSRLLSRALAWLRAAMLSDVTPRWDGAGEDVPELRISECVADRVQTIRVRGEIDRDSADGLRRRLRRAILSGAHAGVVVDLRGVALIDAAGVSVLLDAMDTARGCRVDLSLTGAQPYVARILAVAGLRPRLP